MLEKVKNFNTLHNGLPFKVAAVAVGAVIAVTVAVAVYNKVSFINEEAVEGMLSNMNFDQVQSS